MMIVLRGERIELSIYDDRGMLVESKEITNVKSLSISRVVKNINISKSPYSDTVIIVCELLDNT
jgi:hypothetical protein